MGPIIKGPGPMIPPSFKSQTFDEYVILYSMLRFQDGSLDKLALIQTFNTTNNPDIDQLVTVGPK